MKRALRGRYFEEFAPGEEFVSGARTITEADVSAFGCLTGDLNPLHMDEEYARETSIFGTRIAHGMLGVALIPGMVYQLGINEGTAMAFLESTEKYLRPLRIGDTVYARVTVKDVRPTSKPDRGIVFLLAQLCNQRDEVVTEQLQTVMVRRKA